MLSFFGSSSPFDVVSTVNNDGYLYDSESGIRRNLRVKDSPLPTVLDERLKSVHDVLLEAVRVAGNKSFLGSHASPTDPYFWWTFKAVYERVCDLGSGVLNCCGLGDSDSPNRFLGIYGRNCADWVVSELACATYSLVAVPLYDTLGRDSLKHICTHSELRVCVCVTPDLAQSLLDLNPPNLKHIILIQSDGSVEKLRKQAGDSSIIIHTFNDILNDGKQNPRAPSPSTAEEWLIISYTSGTTGNPKGVIVTNKMLVATVTSTLLNTDLNLFTQHDTYLSFLPLAHIFEQFNVVLALTAHGRIGFYSGDITKLQQDAYALQLTILIAVPRVLARIRHSVFSQISQSRFKTGLMQTAIKRKLKVVDKQIYQHNTMWDQLIFSKIRKRFGGRIRLIITAGAPISGDLLQFTRAAFCCPIFEGYGSTETCGAISCSIFGDLAGGHVGPPLPGCEIKLADVPDMELVASRDNKGEICCRGAVVTPGYYKEPGLTKALVDDDGWIHMGDVGVWTEGNRLKVVDRLKNIFKLSQGEYVAPEKVEQVYSKSSLLTQVFVDGSPLRSYPVALVVPDGPAIARALNEAATAAAASAGLPQDGVSSSSAAGKGKAVKLKVKTDAACRGDVGTAPRFVVYGKAVTLVDLCNPSMYPELPKLVLDDLVQLGRNAGLKGFEQVRAIRLISEEFSLENSLLTPTLKCARFAIRKHFQEELKQLFALRELD